MVISLSLYVLLILSIFLYWGYCIYCNLCPEIIYSIRFVTCNFRVLSESAYLPFFILTLRYFDIKKRYFGIILPTAVIYILMPFNIFSFSLLTMLVLFLVLCSGINPGVWLGKISDASDCTRVDNMQGKCKLTIISLRGIEYSFLGWFVSGYS